VSESWIIVSIAYDEADIILLSSNLTSEVDEGEHEQQENEYETHQVETYTEHQQQEYDYHPSEYENYDYQMDQAGNAMEGMQLVRLSLYAYFFLETFLFSSFDSH